MTTHSSDRRKISGLPIQLKYAMILTLIASSVSLLMIFMMAWFIQRNYNLFMGAELGISSQVMEMVRSEQRMLETSLLLLFILSLSVTFAAAFYITRRLTGPVVALHRHLVLFAHGDWSREFRLRKEDEFKELEALVNRLREQHTAEANAQAAH